MSTPSTYEGFGLPVLEAMRCGVPAIGSDNSSIPEILPEEAPRFDPADVEEMARVIAETLEDDGLRERLSVVRPFGMAKTIMERV